MKAYKNINTCLLILYFCLHYNTKLFAQTSTPETEKLIVSITDGAVKVTSNLKDSILVIHSDRLIDPYNAFLVWEGISFGLIRLYAKLNDYFPSAIYPNFDTVNIEHLLTHTSGYPKGLTISELKNAKNIGSPSEKYNYTSINTDWIKKVITVRHGTSYYNVFKQRLERLGLLNTQWTNKYKEVQTSIEDMAKWLELWTTKTILAPDLIRYFFEPQVKDGNQFYSYGWHFINGEVLLAYDELKPEQFYGVNTNTKMAIFARNQKGFTFEEAKTMVKELGESGKFHWRYLLFLIIPIIIVFYFKKRF